MDEEDTERPLTTPDAQTVATRTLWLATVGAMADVAIDLEQGRADTREADEFLTSLLDGNARRD